MTLVQVNEVNGWKYYCPCDARQIVNHVRELLSGREAEKFSTDGHIEYLVGRGVTRGHVLGLADASESADGAAQFACLAMHQIETTDPVVEMLREVMSRL